ncbi:MAG: HEAT repeat domain-containing protein [Leptolyngbyaceae cyanobacterium bins.59]|nr:HEAT repeat domain-containing protein [Leptolyngbyaceae cyanobacterium bins.59]
MTQAANASELIRAVEQADSPARLTEAVRALTEAQLEAGIPVLIKVLGYNNPEAAGVAVKGLVKLGKVAVPAILEQLDDYNYGARAYSFRALATIADPQALDALLSAAAADFAPSVRKAAAKGLGDLDWSQLPDEQREPAQQKTLEVLLQILQDLDWAIRYAAIVGLQGLAKAGMQGNPAAPSTSSGVTSQILHRFDHLAQADPDLAVRARVVMAQQQLGVSDPTEGALRVALEPIAH